MLIRFLKPIIYISSSVSLLSATTIHVPADSSTIQGGLNGASEGDTVQIASGTYYENIIWPATKGIELIGSGEEDCFIDGDSSGSVIRFADNDGSIVSNFKITGGYAWGNGSVGNGGGIYLSNSNPTLTNLTIEENSTSSDGGGVYCNNYSNPILSNVTITNNSAFDDGGGIYCGSSNPTLTDVTIAENSASRGGGIYCSNSNPILTDVNISGNTEGGIRCTVSSPTLTNVTITDNIGYGILYDNSYNSVMTNVLISGNTGRGIYSWHSTLTLSGVTITGNTDSGIYCGGSNSSIDFSTENLCNIYLNSSTIVGHGADIFTSSFLDVVVDTFTVMVPTEYYVSPIDSFSFDILNSVLSQVEADVYVSETGSNTNDGLTPQTPLQTILYAISIIMPDSANPRTIHIADGTYSPSTNGENFPINMIDYISIDGESELGVVLDADSVAGVINFINTNHSTVSNLTITDGYRTWGGGSGISLSNSSPAIINVTVTDNLAHAGGGIYVTNNSNPNIENVTISNNRAYTTGGGIYCDSLSNVNFSAENRCNIYSNTLTENGNGNDIYSESFLDVVVDTFTVLQPTGYFASPLDSFSFDIINAVLEQVNADLYVSETGSNNNDGLTSDTPLKTIQYATSIIFADSTNPQTIHLASGVYSPSTNGESFPIIPIAYVSVVGESESGVVLDADGGRGMEFISIANATVSNLTIIGGNASNGGGIYCSDSNPIISNVTIMNNSAIRRDVGSGGGIYCGDNSNATIINVTISGNIARNGAGIACYNSNPILSNVVLINNYCTGGRYNDSKGGGIYCYQSNPILTNVNIINNSAYAATMSNRWAEGGGAYYDSSNPVHNNVLITDNYAEGPGGGIFCSNSNPTLTGVTITDNSASYGGGIYCQWNSNPILTNSVLWNNSLQEVYFYQSNGQNSILIAYSDIEGGFDGIEAGVNDTIYWSDGNIDEYPSFVDSANGDYSLQEGSPCIDAGTAFFVWGEDTLVDLSSDEYNGNAPDMGAQEYGAVGNIDELTSIPHNYSLHQNYPNPFNPTTTIQYSLPKRSDVQITIFDMLGREVVSLVSETQDAGYKSVIWDAANISSGMYFYQIKVHNPDAIGTSTYNQTKKMILLR